MDGGLAVHLRVETCQLGFIHLEREDESKFLPIGH